MLPSTVSDFLLYSSETGEVKIDVFLQDETIWLTQKSMSELFDCSNENIRLHLKNIYETAELSENRTTKDSLVVRLEGNREVSRTVKHYNLDAILSVGYRINSLQTTKFRIWASKILKEKQQYETWNKEKQKIHFSEVSAKNFYKEGQIRWVYFGKNIDSEIFGKGDVFSRPALILKKIYGHSCLAIPLTSQDKKGNYYYSFQDNQEKTHCAIFSQIRYVDGKRIGGKMGSISRNTFANIEEKFIDFIKNIPT